MNHTFQYTTALFFLLLLVSSSKLSARILATKQGQEKKTLEEITTEDSLKVFEGSESVDELMGLEDCGKGDDDEECLKRRIIAEAHLDYIYTQHHKP